MLLPDFKAAQLLAPSGRSSDPSWLEGVGKGRPAFLLGGAGGLVESSGLIAATGEIVIGSNWTLRALVPSLWHVVDLPVWKAERERLAGCPHSLVVVAKRGMFGGGPYSVAGSNSLRTVGQRRWPIIEIGIDIPRAVVRADRGEIQHQHTPPFMPKSIRSLYHPGGNSLCYMIQTAHLMGCDPIYCLGFTLSVGTGYFFGLENPVTGKRSFYSDPDRATKWLKWYDSQWPRRARLWPGWSGPVYESLEVVSEDEVRQLVGGRAEPRRAEPVADLRGQPIESTRGCDDRDEPAAQRSKPLVVGQARRQPLHRQRPKGPVRRG